MVALKVCFARNFHPASIAGVPCLVRVVLLLTGGKVLMILHSTCAGDLAVTEVEERRSKVLGQSRPSGLLRNEVVGGSLNVNGSPRQEESVVSS